MSLFADNQITANDAERHFAELLDKVEHGEEVTILRQGSPVARLVPVRSVRTAGERQAAIERWKELSKGLSLGGLTFRDLVDEGRK